MQQPPLPPPSSPTPQALDLTRIVEQQRARVRRVLRARGVAERDLPDAEQDVFLVVHRKLAQFEGRSSLATWLHRIAINVASEHRRKACHRYEVMDGDEAPETRAADPEARLQAREALDRVRAALDALSPEQREAFLLHELVGLSMHEVAAQLHVPLKTAFSRFYAARRGLAAALEQRGIAVSALWAWLGLSLPARLLSRAQALGPAIARAALRAVQLPLVSVALICSVLPSWAETPSAPSALGAAPLHAVASAPQRQRAPRTAPVVAPAQVAAPAFAVAAPAVRPQRVPRATRRVAVAAATPDAAPLTPAVEPAAPSIEYDALIVTRSGALDLRPQLEHPFAARVAIHDAPARIELHGPRDAANALEESLAESRLP